MYQDNLNYLTLIELLDYVSLEEACDELHMGRNRLYENLRNGNLRGSQDGNTWIISKLSILEYKSNIMGIDLKIPSTISIEDLFKPVLQVAS